jgi:hypothetical protein
MFLLEIYMSNVAPLLPILHCSTIRDLFVRAVIELQPLPTHDHWTVLCVYHAALTSMDTDFCLAMTGMNREIWLAEYSPLIHEVLSQPDPSMIHTLLSVQLLLLFLVCCRGNNKSRHVWMMVGVVLRLAKGIGLHRDGSHFRLSPFDCEMRRRTWWHICLLDFRTAEDQGTDPEISADSYDTRLPLNINDDDISVNSKSLPNERIGFTNMTFCLLRCETVIAAQRFSTVLLTHTPPKSVDEKVKLVEDMVEKLEKKYVSACTPEIPIQWVCFTVSRMIAAKFWLLAHRFAGNLRAESLSQSTTSRMFRSSIDVLRFSSALETHPATAQWVWLFQSYRQWQPMAFALSEVCSTGGVSEEDWRIISSTYDGWARAQSQPDESIWQPLSKLVDLAKQIYSEGQRQLH